MDIKVLLTPFAWLQLNSEVRNGLTKAFNIRSSTSPRCVTQNGMTRVESDGKTVEDLMALNAESMQKWLGFTNIDPNADIHALLGMCADKMEKELHPSEVVEPQMHSKEKPGSVDVEMKELIESSKKPFCDSCDSKGARHKSTCIKSKV